MHFRTEQLIYLSVISPAKEPRDISAVRHENVDDIVSEINTF